MRLGYELIKRQLFFQKELIERVSWFIRLRWFAVAAALVGSQVAFFLEPRFQDFFPNEHVALPLRLTAGSAGVGPVFPPRPAILRSGHSPQRASVRQ